ncbi:asparagine--tRNA ligase [Buchnera aphidicola]|uniref:asparagine--tRNA ligase n=1 Tax=Buchnera aphidicola TaxID=9 RepID=UPI0031B6A332
MLVSVLDIYKKKVKINSSIVIKGWVRSKRSSKIGISFIHLYDGSHLSPIQIIAEKKLSNYQDEILKLTTGCSIIVNGKLVKSYGKQQESEIYASNIKVIGWVENPDTYPLSLKKHTNEFLRSIPHLRTRSNSFGAINRIRSFLFHSLHTFLNNKKYYWVPTPIITAINAEGAGSMFKVSSFDFQKIPKQISGKVDFSKDFFGKKTFLTVSGQLTAEAYACAMSKVYTFGPTFRAENSNTKRHLSEFWMLEVETAFSNLFDLTKLVEEIFKYSINEVLKYCLPEILFFEKKYKLKIVKKLERNLNEKIIQVEYSEIIDILKKSKNNFSQPVFFGLDLNIEHEKYIVDSYFNSPVIIKNFPKEIKAFYMRLNNDNKTVSSMDMLVPGIGEIIGGSQREERLSILENRMLELNLKKENYYWYRDLRKYGTVPHSGFGLGFERLLQYITGINNIRDVIPFPRTVRNSDF